MSDMEPFKNLSMLIEKKKRNLEKKKNKLDELKTRQKKGDQLNEDQMKSLTTYSSVVYALENVKDLCDQSIQLNQDVDKISKKQSKRQVKEKSIDSDQKDNVSTTASEEASSIVDPPPAVDTQPSVVSGVDTSQLLIKNMVLQYKIQEVLSDLGNDAIRQCFATGSNGAIKLSSAELEFLDALYPHINPTRESLNANLFEERILTAAKHSTYLFECKEMDISEVGTTYDILHDLFSRILACDFYVTGRHAAVVTEPVESSQTAAINGGETHSTVNPNAAEFYPRFQAQSQSSNAYSADSNVYQTYQDNGDFCNYSQPSAATNVNGPPYQPLSKVIEPLQSNFNFLQISEVDSSSTPAVVNSRDATPNEIVVTSATMVRSPSGATPATATNKQTTQQSANASNAAYFDQSDATNYSEMNPVSTTVSKPPGLATMQNSESGNAAANQPEPAPAEARVESGPVSSWAQLIKKNVPSTTPRVTAASLMHQAPPPAENLYQPYQKSSDVAPARNPSGGDAGEDVFSKATDSQFLNKDNDGWISSSKPHHNRSNKPRGNAAYNKDNQAGGPPNGRNGFRGRPGGRGGNANTQFGGRGGSQGAARGGFTANLKQTWS